MQRIPCIVAQWIPIECSGFDAAWPNGSRLNAVDSMQCGAMDFAGDELGTLLQGLDLDAAELGDVLGSLELEGDELGELVEGLDLDAAASDALLADVEAAADSDETGGDESAAEDTGGEEPAAEDTGGG